MRTSVRERELKPKVNSLSAAMSSWEKGGVWRRPLGLLDEMKERELKLDVISFNSAVSSCEKGV